MQSSISTAGSSLPSPMPYSKTQDYREQVMRELLSGLTFGVRVVVKDGEDAGAVAERILRIHEEIMIKAEQRGIIPPLEQIAE